MEFLAARKIAVAICYRLQPHCTLINLAGSIRRMKAEVKDIEIICLPKKKEVFENTLFGQGESSFVVDPEFVEIVNSLGKVIKGKPTGKYIQIELPENINLDLFIPDDFDYYRQFCVRTGSADYSHKVIAAAWKRKGWCGSDKGLRKISDCTETKGSEGKSKYQCLNKNAEKPPVWGSEEEFFKWLGVKWIEPKLRFIPKYN